ncbi:DNA-directed RNA polymerases IV and V subunit 4-like isoform X2 [Carica papaya]|uniref:DNA-directed RNA polymerases IV and V subunit 4-like isoform X2 n=1 Tax=Carica papaya TaxID=3649 RepID=UPI000B8CF38D|nr:DNA-directed RNA polymerases IV and V subunit 4-like isoform X2 [Carica papaya]XP_021902162.1 DNA-directed RNA polymerases IV and V subunit 4-like isoform X2 [Carica papaya]
MSEKGGKGFSLPSKGAKSSLKGKDDSSAKSKRGRKVHFNAEGLSEPNLSSPLSSDGKFQGLGGDRIKVGKGDKSVKGGKISAVKEPQPLELKIGAELPENAKCLMDCEAALILEGIQDQMVVLSRDPTIKIPVSFDKGLQYAKSKNNFTDPQPVRKLLETLTNYGVTDGEICVIANAHPETIDEVFALVPSLKDKRSSISKPLEGILSGLANLRNSS